MEGGKRSQEKKSFSITAIGDVLLHGRVYGGLKKRKDFTLNEQLSGVKGLLGGTDLTVANLETPITGEGKLSGFPTFNAPIEIGYVLKDLGVDLVTLANNHVLDQGEKGLRRTIKNLKKIGLLYDGAFESVEDSETLRVFTKNGIRVCFLSFTNSINGYGTRKYKSYLVNNLKTSSVLRLSKLIRKLKRDNITDAIIINLHFGSEYHLDPTNRQREIVTSLSDAGANVIIGHHPHVLQPPEWIENSLGTKTFVAYSLGNFFSGQNGLHRQIGGALSFKLTKDMDNEQNGINIEDVNYNLTFVNRTKRLRYDAYILKDWVAKNPIIRARNMNFSSEDVYQNVLERMRKNIYNLHVE